MNRYEKAFDKVFRSLLQEMGDIEIYDAIYTLKELVDSIDVCSEGDNEYLEFASEKEFQYRQHCMRNELY